MVVHMSRVQIADDVSELREEAASARELASAFDDGQTVTELLNYAAALEREATRLGSQFPTIFSPAPASLAIRFGVASREGWATRFH